MTGWCLKSVLLASSVLGALAIAGEVRAQVVDPGGHYGRSPTPETPYQRAAQVWDDRIGSARVQARNWRLAALMALGLSGGLAAGLVVQSARGGENAAGNVLVGLHQAGGDATRPLRAGQDRLSLSG